jgi:hypothetical protein
MFANIVPNLVAASKSTPVASLNPPLKSSVIVLDALLASCSSASEIPKLRKALGSNLSKNEISAVSG